MKMFLVLALALFGIQGIIAWDYAYPSTGYQYPNSGSNQYNPYVSGSYNQPSSYDQDEFEEFPGWDGNGQIQNPGQFPGNQGQGVQNFPNQNPGQFPGNQGQGVQNFPNQNPGQFPGNQGQFPGNQGQGMGNFPNQNPGQFPGNQGQGMGNFPNQNPGQFPGNQGQGMGNFPNQNPGQFPGNQGQGVGNFPSQNPDQFPGNQGGVGGQGQFPPGQVQQPEEPDMSNANCWQTGCQNRVQADYCPAATKLVTTSECYLPDMKIGVDAQCCQFFLRNN